MMFGLAQGRNSRRRTCAPLSRLVVPLVTWIITVGVDVAVTGPASRWATGPGGHATDLGAAAHYSDDARIPATLFGMHTMGLVYPVPIPFGAQAKSTGTAWPYLETVPGVFDWSGEDAAVATAAANRVAPPFYSTDGIPSWATTDTKRCKRNFLGGALLCSAMMKNIGDWDAFVIAFVSRYKGRMIYELWNEPNTIYFSGTVHDMVIITNHEHDIIRRIDPTAIIIAPSGGAAYMDRFFAAGGTRDVDVVSYHEYNSTPEDVIGTINSLRWVLAKYGLADKPLWDTEGGWGPIPYVNGTVEDYPGYIARRYLIEWSLGTDRFYWYAWNNDRFGTLTNASNVANPAGIAYSEVYGWMVGARMISPCKRNQTVWKCGFARSGGYRASAVWNTNGNSLYAAPKIYRQYKELNGSTTAFNPGTLVSIGFRPILFEDRTAESYGSFYTHVPDSAYVQPCNN
jgi:hypothetical protein